jgi:hypothetical protein
MARLTETTEIYPRPPRKFTLELSEAEAKDLLGCLGWGSGWGLGRAYDVCYVLGDAFGGFHMEQWYLDRREAVLKDAVRRYGPSLA